MLLLIARLLEISSQMEGFTCLGPFILFLLFSPHVEQPFLRRFHKGLCRFHIKCRLSKTTSGYFAGLISSVIASSFKALKELKLCLEHQKTDESHFQLVLSLLTLTEQHSMDQRVSHTLCLSGECTHCPSKIKLISTCRKG